MLTMAQTLLYRHRWNYHMLKVKQEISCTPPLQCIQLSDRKQLISIQGRYENVLCVSMDIVKHSCIPAWCITNYPSITNLPQEFNASGKPQCGQDLVHTDHWRWKGAVFVKKHAPSGTPDEVKGYWCKGRNSHCAGQVSPAGLKLSCIDQKVERLKTESCIVFWTLAFTALEHICNLCPT